MFSPSLIILMILCSQLKTLPSMDPKQTSNMDFSNLSNNSSCSNCIISVISQSNVRNVHLLCSEQTYCPTNVVRSFPKIAWTSHIGSEVDNIFLAFKWEDLCVFCANNILDMLSLLRQHGKCHKAKIILAFTRAVQPHEDELESVFNVTWKLGVVDVVAILTNQPNESALLCNVYSYVPFTQGKCFNTSPQLLNSWKCHRNCALNYSVNYFPREKLSNLRLCELQVEYDIPNHKLDSDWNIASERIRWYRLLSFLMCAMNAKLRLKRQMNLHFPDTHYDSTDILFSHFWAFPDTTVKFIVSPIRSSYSGIGLCFPSSPILSIPWYRMFSEFSSAVWYCITVCLGSTVIILYLTLGGRRDLLLMVLFTFQSLIGVAVPVNMSVWQGRVYMCFWLAFCLVLSNSYVSFLKSRLTVRFTEEAINNMDDFVAANIPINIPLGGYDWLVTEIWPKPEDEPIVNLLVPRNESYWDMLLEHKHKGAYICGEESIDYIFRNKPTKFILLKYIPMFFFLLPKPSPYERLLTRSVLRIFDSGAFSSIKSKVTVNDSGKRRRSDAAKPLSLLDLSAVFVIWVLGCGLAFLVFVIESLTRNFIPCACGRYFSKTNLKNGGRTL